MSKRRRAAFIKYAKQISLLELAEEAMRVFREWLTLRLKAYNRRELIRWNARMKARNGNMLFFGVFPPHLGPDKLPHGPGW